MLRPQIMQFMHNPGSQTRRAHPVYQRRSQFAIMRAILPMFSDSSKLAGDSTHEKT